MDPKYIHFGFRKSDYQYEMGIQRVTLQSDVAPGASVAFVFQVRAPSDPGFTAFSGKCFTTLNDPFPFGELTPNRQITVSPF
jgi:hypothetical protein